MTIPTDHYEPWTEDEFFALGETGNRIQLFDGTLLVGPAPTVGHQRILGEVASALGPGADACRLHVLPAINLRLKPGQIPIPDLVICSDIDFDELVVPVDAVELICEIDSPTSAATDRLLKKAYYAEAGIPWYLLVEHETATVHLYRLDGDKYVEHATAKPGAILHLTEPVTAEIDPEALLPRR